MVNSKKFNPVMPETSETLSGIQPLFNECLDAG